MGWNFLKKIFNFVIKSLSNSEEKNDSRKNSIHKIETSNIENNQAGRDNRINQVTKTFLTNYCFNINLPEPTKQEIKKNKDAYWNILEEKLNKLTKDHEELKKIFYSVNFRHIFNTALESAVRTNSAELHHILSSLIIERINKDNTAKNLNENPLQIAVLNKAVECINDLTIKQINIISFIFLMRHVSFGPNNIDSLIVSLNEYIFPILDSINHNCSRSEYEYIACVGLSKIDFLSNRSSVTKLFLKDYPNLFIKGFLKEEFSKIEVSEAFKEKYLMPCLNDSRKFQIKSINEEDIINYCKEFDLTPDTTEKILNLNKKSLMSEDEMKNLLVNKDAKIQQIFLKWDNTSLTDMVLTPIGIAIAHSHIQQYTSKEIDLSIWIKN